MAQPADQPAKRTRIRRGYHSQELLPVVVVSVSVAMAGRMLAAAVLLLVGLGYWGWVVLQDRMRPLVSVKGGVRPDGTDLVFGANRLESAIELIRLWLDSKPGLAISPSVKCAASTASEEEESEEETATAGQPVGSAWFPPDHSQDRFERELRDEALTSGLLVVSRLLAEAERTQEAQAAAVEAVQLRAVELAVDCVEAAHHREATSARGLETLCVLVQGVRADQAVVADVAARVRVPRLLRLLSSSALQRQPLALRRGLQLLGLLADSADVQEQLVEGRALELVATTMRRHTNDATIAQWGCWALFCLLFEFKGAAEEETARGDLAGDRGGFFAALLRAVTAAMTTHATVQPVQQCGAMATLAFVSLHGLSRPQATELLLTSGGVDAVTAANNAFPANKEIQGVWQKLAHVLQSVPPASSS